MADVDENETKSAALRLRDEDGEVRRAFVAEVARAIEAGDRIALHDLAADLHQSDVGALLEALEHDERPRLIELMGSDFDFAALTEVDDKVREDILEDLPAVERVALQRSLDYPENSAGRLMQTTLVRAPAFWTAGQTLDHIHDVDDEELPDSFFEIFVVDPGHRLLGNVFLDRLVRAKRSARLDELMDPDRRRVHVNDDQEEVARFFERYNLISAPVVDDADRLMGVITIDDVVDVIREEASEDMGALGGVSAEEELSDTVWWTAKNRFLWLFVNLITAFMASSVIGLFEGQVEKMVALAVLVPIVASQGGNAATQTMTVAVRALATRELSRANAMRVVRRELFVGCINGLGFGLLTGLMAGAWFGLPSLGMVIGLAMLTNMIAGALGGILIPMVLDRFEADPAVSSGAFVTTVTDVVGNFSFLGIATLWFGLG
jgi:magnesium transporter